MANDGTKVTKQKCSRIGQVTDHDGNNEDQVSNDNLEPIPLERILPIIDEKVNYDASGCHY